MNIHLLLAENCLTVAPSDDVVEKCLTVRERRLQRNPKKPWEFQVRVKARKVFKVIREVPRVVQTMQGFWLELKQKLEEEGCCVTLEDLRKDFPKPRLDLMHGFRYSQEELLRQFLLADHSGLLVAPTRWGKTALIINTLRAYTGVTTVVTAPGLDLIRQLYEAIKIGCPGREVKLLGASGKARFPSEDITVCSMDSLDKCDMGRTRLLIIDEPHAAVTEARLPVINAFINARRMGFGATPTGRFDMRDPLVRGLIGPIWAERTYLEAVAGGYMSLARIHD